MALKLTTSLNIANKVLSFDDAYLKVSNINGNKTNITVSVDYLTEQNGQLIQRKDYNFVQNLDGGNIIEQSYLYLKTLPEFSNATNC